MQARLLNELVLRHAGRPIVVMGGAPSLPSDVERVKRADAWISANEHGARLRGADYIVYVDETNQRLRKPMYEILEPFGVPLISERFHADYRIPDWSRTGFLGNCGMHAIWVAWMLGGHPIIVCGIENYAGGTYWHDEGAWSTSSTRPRHFFDGRLRELQGLIGDAAVRPVSGPLTKFWPRYDPDEEFPRYAPPAALAKMTATEGVRVRMTRNRTIGRTVLKAGDEVSLSPREHKRYKRITERAECSTAAAL